MLQKSAETDVSELLKLLPTMLRAKLRNLVHLIYMSLFFHFDSPLFKNWFGSPALREIRTSLCLKAE